MLADRIAVADKYFSSGETKGSETLRGKVVIVFGPPSSIEREAAPKGAARPDLAAIQAASGSNGRDSQPTISSAGKLPRRWDPAEAPSRLPCSRSFTMRSMPRRPSERPSGSN